MDKTPETELERVQRITQERLKDFLETERMVMADELAIMEYADPLAAQLADLRRRVEALEKKFPPPKKRRTRR